MVVVRQFPRSLSLTVLNPGEYTARSDDNDDDNDDDDEN